MHIPDGYLSPQTCAVAYAAAVPTWVVASRKVGKVVRTRNVPLLAMFAALSFLIMMFNIPIPDGTSAHAVGAVVVAVVLGPWAAVIAVSVALLFQALLFGDGGVLAYGANVLNMAIVLPFVGLAVYRAVAGRSPLTSRRRVIAAATSGSTRRRWRPRSSSASSPGSSTVPTGRRSTPRTTSRRPFPRCSCRT